MSREKIAEILAASQSFAHDHKSSSHFKGYSEEEIVKGFAISFMLLDDIVKRKGSGNSPALMDDRLLEISKFVGVQDGEWIRVYDVFLIISDIICAKKEATAHE